MKYIKKLNIDFNDWENYDNEDFDKLDKFFKQTKILFSYRKKYGLYINKKSVPYIIDYLKNNNMNLRWTNDMVFIDHLFDVINIYGNIILYLNNDMKVMYSSNDNLNKNIIKFLK